MKKKKNETYIPTDKDFRRLLDNISRNNFRGTPTSALSLTPVYLAALLILFGVAAFLSHEWALSMLKEFTPFP